ncbi:MAG: DUF262 domain-containing protein [Bacteroidota bacterium]
MKNTIDTQSGERLSFYKLFSQKKYRILIPIIQRDYAQGRKTTKEVRNTFLDALYKYLFDNKPNRDLDFVYGSLSEENGVTDFIPLDGQQRLTTLFLLHWYLYQTSDNVEKKKEYKFAIVKEGKSMFTYETRSSSTEFCDALMCNDIDFDNLQLVDKDSKGNSKENSLSKTIKNCSWFYLSWQYDPTIQSMLTMLDAIHMKFTNKEGFFERLLDTENPIITFLFLNLKDFKLTDDLYIKMNSRGKPLTPFENFKAKFEQSLETLNIERKFTLNFNNKQKEISAKEYFSYNIDTKWANLFWNYRTLQNRSKTDTDDTFDDELMNFIRVIFTNQYAMVVKITSKEKDDTLEYLLGTNVAKKDKEYSDIISFNKYEELKALSPKGIIYLIDAFNSFANGNEKIRLHLSDNYKFYFDESAVFKNSLKHNFESNQQRLCFHAYVRFLIVNNTDRSGIEQWMRVIHNLTHPENTVIDNAMEVAAAIQSIEELLPQSNNILQHLKLNPNIELFSSWQILEEKIKAHLITKNDEWKLKIETIEKHRYFNGQIGFILEFSGILEYFNSKKNCDWNSNEDVEYFRQFSNYSENARFVFEESYENRKNNKGYVFERAVLSKGDYLTVASQYRKNLLSSALVKNNIKRDHSWKRLLRLSDDDWNNRRLLVKQVFDDNRFSKDNIVKTLTTICSDKTDSWRDYFIACPNLIKYCNQGFIRFEDEHHILLYGESQSNFYHAEMYTYYLWKMFIELNVKSFEPFKYIYYNQVKSIEDSACIILNDFCLNKIYYEVHIYYGRNYSSLKPYEIALKKSRGENNPGKYGESIKEVLDQLKFDWSDDNKCYFLSFANSDLLLKKLKSLTESLNELD